MNTRILTIGGLIAGVILLFAVNILSADALKSARLDLTAGQLYTLSEGSRGILGKLDEPVTLRLFLSEQLATGLPSVASYTNRVRELLDEYRRASGDMLRVIVIDPEPFSEDEDRAVGYGLTGVPLTDGESSFYFGLAASGPTDAEAVIPFLSPEREPFIEYDITKLIHQVAFPERRVVGLLSSLPVDGDPQAAMMGAPSQPWVVLEQVRQFFEVQTLDTDLGTIPDAVNVLMIVHPKALPDKTLYAIDQFVLAGGRALVFVDPNAEADTAGGFPGAAPQGSNLEPLLSAWGVDFAADQVSADLQLAERVRFNRGGRMLTVDYPVWMVLPPEQIDAEDIVTAELGSLMLATPGALSAGADASTTLTPLAQTTGNATRIDTARLGPMSDPQDLLRDYQSGGEPLTLIARVTGPVSSAFPDGAPADPPDAQSDAEAESGGADAETELEDPDRPHLSESAEPVNLIVVADSDLLQDRFWVQVQNLLGSSIAIPTAANGSLVVNALDNLVGSNELISVRNRGHFSRPFTRVDTLRQEAELKYRQKEQELLTRLEETEQRLLALERGDSTTAGNALVLSPEQQAEIDRFRLQKVQIRKDLRRVRHELQKDIESLETRVKLINVALVPLVIAIGGVLVAVGSFRRRRARATPATLAQTG